MQVIRLLKGLLIITALLPLIYIPILPFPFILGKALFFRLMINLSILAFLVTLIRSPGLWRDIKIKFKNPIFILISLFVLSALISVLFSVDIFRSFWGSLERMEGFIMTLHFFAFLVMTVAVFEKKDWLRFFKFLLVISGIVAFYGLLQFLGIEKFPFAFPARNRPDVFLGNSGYVANYFLLILFSSFIVFYYSIKKSFWYYFSSIIAVLSVLMIFLAASRGVFAGLLVGSLVLLFYLRKSILNNKRYRIAFIVVIILGVGFLATRSLPFWQSVPGVNRIASFSLDHPTVQTRILTYGSGVTAFKERPLLGWGPENFNVAYNKHYNPAYLIYSNRWFDRAHNKLLDIGVMQGSLGLILYLLFFIALLYKLGKIPDKRLAKILTIFFVAYFIQSLFWFDHLTGYLIFYLFVGFSIFLTTKDNQFTQINNEKIALVGKILLVVFSISFLWLSYHHYVILRQSKTLMDIRKKYSDARVIDENLDKVAEPYNGIQLELRGILFEHFYSKKVFDQKNISFLADKMIFYLEDLIEKDSLNPISYIRIIEAYHKKALEDPEFYKKSEAMIKRAQELSPHRQELFSHRAYNLFFQGKKKEAIAVSRESVELAPDVAYPHYILGLMLSLVGGEHSLEGEVELSKALSMRGGHFLSSDYSNMVGVFSKNITSYVHRNDINGVLRNARHLRKVLESYLPDKVGRVDRLIGFAERSDWQNIYKLLAE